MGYIMGMKKKMPHACPSQDEIWSAIEILDDQWLHFYQLLYFKGLTNPGGYPFTVERHFSSGTNRLTAGIDIYPKDHPEFKFTVFEHLQDAEVELNLQLIQEAIQANKPKLEYACCPLATPRQCVCMASFECPIHGNTCVGTHD